MECPPVLPARVSGRSCHSIASIVTALTAGVIKKTANYHKIWRKIGFSRQDFAKLPLYSGIRKGRHKTHPVARRETGARRTGSTGLILMSGGLLDPLLRPFLAGALSVA
jgi:hypothetical protein